jgi:hypothetical protein
MTAELELPRTAAVESATSLVERLGPPSLANHALRTWAWGTLLGLRDGLTWDRETFALAALLHDLGLAQRSKGVTCFAVDGAWQANELLHTWGAPEYRRNAVADAICLHLRVAVPPELGVEAHLVHDGAGVDVIGSRLSAIPPETRARVLAKYPRGDLKEFLAGVLGREGRENPSSRMGLWVSFGFLDRVRRAPFDS